MSYQPSFWNTTHLTGAELQQAIRDAQQQDDAILTIFRNASGPLSPSDVWRLCEQAGKRWPLTSVRRAITTLTKANALTQTGDYKRGVFGKKEHLWSRAA